MKQPRWSLIVLLITLGILTVGAAGWALHTIVVVAPAPAVDDEGVTAVAVRQGTVGQTFSLNTSATWTAGTVGRNRAAGTVTSVWLRSAATVRSGTRLYAVNLRPVVAISGSTPMFRDLTVGAEGPDVRQLERLLVGRGYLSAADRRFTAATAAAVKRWQRSIGTKPDGVIGLGDVVFVRSLPARLGLDKAISTGVQLSGGEKIRAFDEPRFVIRTSREQATRMTTGSRVEITGPGGQEWTAKVARTRSTNDDNYEVDLAPAGRLTSICAADCDQIPTSGQTLLVAVIEVVKPTSGLIVPAAAVITNASGATMVVLTDGTRIPVNVKVTAGGQSVITGVTLGQLVRAPAR